MREHKHLHTGTKELINRISRAAGHLQAIKKMVEENRDCTEVLIQLSAVRSAINNIGQIILKDHIEHCLIDAVELNDFNAIEKLNDAIAKFLK